MTKIVINRCYGGFGLSDKAIKRYGEIKGINLVKIPYKNRDGEVSDFFGTWYRDGVEDDDNYFPMYDIERTDPALVQVVEELGEEASGDCAKLAIAEVSGPYRIDEYDGAESVVEPDDYDWITP